MSRRCAITGRGPRVGHNVSHAHNITLRRWNVNLQKVRILIDGRVRRVRVSTAAIKSGLITRPPLILKAKQARPVRPATAPAIAAATAYPVEPESRYFSEGSVVTRLFKPKVKPEEAAVTEAAVEELDVAESKPNDEVEK
ncbi:MAG: 50S ribosomal protein L28 [Calditrichaeota bacterium]|nr:50S ribosomal protein L28 [Calditrichota bacterium]